MKKTLLLMVGIVHAIGGKAQTVLKKFNLPTSLAEISGMLSYKNGWLVHGDGGSPAALFAIDSLGKITDTFSVNQSNNDWEELTENKNYYFIGDFGNNNGTRKDLKILMLKKDSMGRTNRAGIIRFSYKDQSDFSSNTFSDFDCEAMAAVGDSLWLFSKSKSTGICRIYAVAAAEGNYVLSHTDTLQVPFWATGAAVQNNQLLLLGYGPNWDLSLLPWVYTARIVNGRIDHKTGRSYLLNIPGSKQCEGVCFGTGGRMFLSSEFYRGDSAALFELQLPTGSIKKKQKQEVVFHPNPVITETVYRGDDGPAEYSLHSLNGAELQRGMLAKNQKLDMRSYQAGVYAIRLQSASGVQYRLLVKQ